MAQPIDFTPPIPTRELHPTNAAGALSAIQAKHDHPEPDPKCLLEVLEVICCAVGAKAVIAGQLTGLVNRPNGVPVLRNLLMLIEILGKLKFESLSDFASGLDSIDTARIAQEPPSLWQLFRSAEHPDVRRGLSLLLQTTQALGKAIG